MSVNEKRKLDANGEADDGKPKKKLLTRAAYGFDTTKYDESEYYLENGLRKVYPYHFTYNTFCKGRWIGKKVIDVYREEFRSRTLEHIMRMAETGQSLINGKKVDPRTYVLQNNDFMTNTVHRHELPVLPGNFKFVHESDDWLVIDKPPSIPVHPCGRYRYNSIVCILEKEFGFKHLHVLHRLDRLTSGLLLFAKDIAKARQLEEEIRSRTVSKEYVCRVEGDFPEGEIICDEALHVISHKIGVCIVSKEKGKPCTTAFKKLHFNGKSSVVSCRPKTGRMHQIRVHLQYLGYPIVNDPLYNTSAFGPNKGKNGDYNASTYEEIMENLKVLDTPKFAKPITEADLTVPETDPNIMLSLLGPYSDASKFIGTNYTFDPSKMTEDAFCDECKTIPWQPKPEEMFIYLHALRYKGENWEFSTELPMWAKEDWSYD